MTAPDLPALAAREGGPKSAFSAALTRHFYVAPQTDLCFATDFYALGLASGYALSVVRAEHLEAVLRDAGVPLLPTVLDRDKIARLTDREVIRTALRDAGVWVAHALDRYTDAVLAVLPGRTEPTPQEWESAILAERDRQREKWGDRHDRQHGPDHLLALAEDYGRRGRPVQAAALVRAARELLARAARLREGGQP